MLKPHRPLRIAVLCSHRAPGLLYLLSRSVDRGATFEIACVVTSEETFAEEVRVERRGIPTLVHSIRDFYERRGLSRCFDLEARADYDARTAVLVEPYFPDVILLDGYLYLVTAPLLARFSDRILNLHFGDLTLRNRDGGPRFPGVRAVRDALTAGCPGTRATVHLVNARPDDGPPIVRSWPFPVSPLVEDMRTLTTTEAFKAYAFAHEHWMLHTVSGPLVAAALRLVATGAVDLDELADRPRGCTAPWTLDRRGVLLAPEGVPSGAPALVTA